MYLILQSWKWLQGHTGCSAEWKTSSTCWLSFGPEATSQHAVEHVYLNCQSIIMPWRGSPLSQVYYQTKYITVRSHKSDQP